MAIKTIYIQGTPYHLYETYEEYEEAKKTARYKKKCTRTKYFILTKEVGYLFPKKRYELYFNKIMKMW